jgi:hypothetical protein
MVLGSASRLGMPPWKIRLAYHFPLTARSNKAKRIAKMIDAWAWPKKTGKVE